MLAGVEAGVAARRLRFAVDGQLDAAAVGALDHQAHRGDALLHRGELAAGIGDGFHEGLGCVVGELFGGDALIDGLGVEQVPGVSPGVRHVQHEHRGMGEGVGLGEAVVGVVPMPLGEQLVALVAQSQRLVGGGRALRMERRRQREERAHQGQEQGARKRHFAGRPNLGSVCGTGPRRRGAGM